MNEINNINYEIALIINRGIYKENLISYEEYVKTENYLLKYLKKL